MTYVTGIIAIISLCFLISGVIAIFRKTSDNETNTVYLPRFTVIIGTICCFTFLIPTVLLIFSGDKTERFAALIFALFTLLGDYLIIGYVNCRIFFDFDTFVYKNIFGKKRTIAYKDLTGIKGKKDVKLYAGKYTIDVDEMAINNKKFLLHAKKQYKLHHGGLSIPKSAKKDLFNNHVESPAEFIFVFGLLGSICLIGTIAMIIAAINEINREYTEKVVIAQCYEISEDDLLFYNTDNERFCIDNYNAVTENTDELFSHISSKKELTLQVYFFDTKEPYYSVSDVYYNGNQYINHEAWLKNSYKNITTVLIIFGIFDLVIGIFIFTMIYIGRNPHKFSDRVLHWFYKPGYIHRN
ncbi:MAG: hypothetical protein E7490_01395 [Ruminococcaceae bacterium]|nr:hypothetical protein [Oscillospiraceae bacterium]